MSDYLSVADIADRYGFSETTVREWLRKGKIKGFKVGSTWRIKEGDIPEGKDTAIHPLLVKINEKLLNLEKENVYLKKKNKSLLDYIDKEFE